MPYLGCTAWREALRWKGSAFQWHMIGSDNSGLARMLRAAPPRQGKLVISQDCDTAACTDTLSLIPSSVSTRLEVMPSAVWSIINFSKTPQMQSPHCTTCATAGASRAGRNPSKPSSLPHTFLLQPTREEFLLLLMLTFNSSGDLYANLILSVKAELITSTTAGWLAGRRACRACES